MLTMESTKVITVEDAFYFNKDRNKTQLNGVFLKAFHNIDLMFVDELQEEIAKIAIEIKQEFGCDRIALEVRSMYPNKGPPYKNHYGHVVMYFSGKKAMQVALKYPDNYIEEFVRDKFHVR